MVYFSFRYVFFFAKFSNKIDKFELRIEFFAMLPSHSFETDRMT